MADTKQFGRLARDHRERLGLTIAKVAELCELSEHGYSNIELGDSDPKLSHAMAIAAVLKIDMGELNMVVLERA